MRTFISRTATFAWSPANVPDAEPLIVTGTLSGALDESFSNDSVLEIWKPQFGAGEDKKPIATASTGARFNRLAWGYVCAERPMGVIAAGFENGELILWDAKQVIDGDENPLIFRNNQHTGPIKGLHFNPKQPHLLASGGINGEIYIWDLSNPGKPYSPGARSTKLDEITALSWNPEVPHILATSSSSGYTVVWNLREKKELAALAYGGGASTTPANVNGINSNAAMAVSGGRRGMGALCWHPDQPTRLATASDDDASPLVMLWDLRNSRAPEKILSGHSGGVLSLSWCKQDADLMLSCGKDNRTICWNPQAGQIVGELSATQNWSYDVQFCPKNPSMVAVASFDGRITFNSLQDTNPTDAPIDTTTAPTDVNDVFDSLPAQSEANNRGVSLTQPPKWLKRPISAVFGFGGQLVTTSNLPGDKGQTQSAVVHIRGVVTEPSIASRAQRLQDAINSQSLADFCSERSKDTTTRPDDIANWKALQTLFQADNRDELVALLGFSKEDVAERVAASIGAFKRTSAGALAPGLSLPNTPPAPATSAEAISAATGLQQDDGSAVADAESDQKTPPASAAALSDAFNLGASASATSAEAEKAPEVNLFGAQDGSDAADLFNSIGGESESAPAPLLKSALPDYLTQDGSVTPGGGAAEASVAATAGSPRAMSIASAEGPRTDTFRIYPDNEGELDKLVTRALVLGDFESAVSLCLSTDRHADAILLAVRGGPELLARTQKAYFERKTTTLPYLRLFQSIVSDDLSDIVQNADLNEWQEIFVVVCTFAKRSEDFVHLVEQLGQRLEFQYTSSTAAAAKTYRKNAVLCYLAAGKLEKVASMWIDEMKEEEIALQSGQAANGKVNGDSGEAASSLYSAHAEALQTFMEKITVFQSAVNYIDLDLSQQCAQSVEEAAARTFKLAPLYDRILEYVDLLADQGLIAPALTYINQTPQDYRAGDDNIVALSRERLRLADQAKTGGKGAAAAAAQAAASAAAATAASSSTATTMYAPQQVQQAQATTAPSSYNAYGQTNAYQSYGGATSGGYDNYAPTSQPAYDVQSQQGYAPAQAQQQVQQPQYQNAFQPQQQQFQQPSQSAYAPAQPMVPAPPPPIMNVGAQEVPQQQSVAPPPPPKKPDGGWNDIPASLAPKRTTSAMSNRSHAPQPITSPFPNAPTLYAGPGNVPPQQPSYGQGSPAAAAVPPPPRGLQPQRGVISPPPGNAYGRPQQMGQGPPPPQQQQQQPAYMQQQQQQAPPPRPPPTGPPRGGTPAGSARPGQPISPPQQGAPSPYAPAPGQVPVPPPPSGATNNFGGGAPPYGQQQQQQQQPFQRPPMPAMPPSGPPSNVPMRSVTPGAGAGPPPARSATPGGKPAPKYPPGDRSHVPESGKPILATFTKELARIKGTIPATQRRYVDDAERRMNLLLDQLNCATLEPRVVQALLGICQAIEARNQQAALAQHVQLFSTTSGDVSSGLVGLKFVISKINQ